MKRKLTEDQKVSIKDKLKDTLKDDSFKQVNTAAQNVLKQASGIKSDSIIDVLDWIEDYLLALKNR